MARATTEGAVHKSQKNQAQTIVHKLTEKSTGFFTHKVNYLQPGAFSARTHPQKRMLPCKSKEPRRTHWRTGALNHAIPRGSVWHNVETMGRQALAGYDAPPVSSGIPKTALGLNDIRPSSGRYQIMGRPNTECGGSPGPKEAGARTKLICDSQNIPLTPGKGELCPEFITACGTSTLLPQ